MKEGRVETDDDEAIRRMLGWGGLDKSALFFVEDEDDKPLRAILRQWPDLYRQINLCRCFGIENLPRDKFLQGLLVDGELKVSALLHRDADFMNAEETELWKARFQTDGVFSWVTAGSDVEAYFCEVGYPFRSPIGYRSQGKAELKMPDPAYAPFIKLAFELYASGEYSLRSLQKEMQRRGFRSKNGRDVSRSSLEKILENPFYCGTVRLQRSGHTYKGKHKALISASLFERVQRIKSGKTGKKTTKHNHTFKGLFHCAQCRSLLTGELQKGKVYYRCHVRGCPSKTVREDAIDHMVLALIQENAISSEDADLLVSELKRRIGTIRQDEEVRCLKLQLDQTDARLGRLTSAFLDELITRDEFQDSRAHLLLEKERLQERLTETRQKRLSDAMIEKFFERVRSVENNYRNAKPHDKRSLALWVTSNRRMDGEKASIEPSNWLHEAKTAVGGLKCGDAKANFRTLIDAINGNC